MSRGKGVAEPPGSGLVADCLEVVFNVYEADLAAAEAELVALRRELDEVDKVLAGVASTLPETADLGERALGVYALAHLAGAQSKDWTWADVLRHAASAKARLAQATKQKERDEEVQD